MVEPFLIPGVGVDVPEVIEQATGLIVLEHADPLWNCNFRSRDVVAFDTFGHDMTGQACGLASS
jgi:hypothetical protein